MPGPIDVVAEETSNRYSSWCHIFQGANTTWIGANQLTIGNFFNGLPAQCQNMWNAQIPPLSKILSATVEFTPAVSNANPSFTTKIVSPDRGPGAPVAHDAILLPFEPFLGYRQNLWSTESVGCLSTTFTTVAATSITPNASWNMAQEIAPGATVPFRRKLAQLIETRTGNMEVDFAFWELQRFGSPSGSMVAYIQGTKVDRGLTVPDDDNIIATSDPVLCSSILTGSFNIVSFTFSSNPVLEELTEYFWTLEAPYSANGTDYIAARHRNQFFTGGNLWHYGEGLGADYQNCPGTVDVNQALCTDGYPSEATIWPLDSVIAGVTETSPDISALVQAQVNETGYTIDSGIILAFILGTPTAQNRKYWSNIAPGQPGAILRVTYLEPGGKTRTHDKFNDLRDYNAQARREDDELIVIGEGICKILN